MEDELTDDQWRTIQPLIAKQKGPGKPRADAYEEWLKRQPAAPSTRGQKDRVEADVYEAWLRQRVERRRPSRT